MFIFKDVYIQDFVGALKMCKCELLKLYADSTTTFVTNDHHIFLNLTQLSHYDIYLKSDNGGVGGGHVCVAFVVNKKIELAYLLKSYLL